MASRHAFTRGTIVRQRPRWYRCTRYSSPLSTSTHIIAKCQCRAPPSQPPSVSHAGAGVPSNGHQANGGAPFGAKAGYALKMRSPEAAITSTATALTQWVRRAMG